MLFRIKRWMKLTTWTCENNLEMKLEDGDGGGVLSREQKREEKERMSW